MPYKRYVPSGVEAKIDCACVTWLWIADYSLAYLSRDRFSGALVPGLVGAPGIRAISGAIKPRRGARLCSFSLFLLHTYLVPIFPAQELGKLVRRACIAQRGVILAPLSFGAMGGAIFDIPLVFIVSVALSSAMRKTFLVTDAVAGVARCIVTLVPALRLPMEIERPATTTTHSKSSMQLQHRRRAFDLRDARSYSHFLVAFVLAAFIAARLAQ